MLRLFGKPKWLIAFINDGSDDGQAFSNWIVRLQEILECKASPFQIIKVEGSALKEIGSKVSTDMETTDMLQQVLVNGLIKKKKEFKMSRLAVVLKRSHFFNEDAYVEAITDTYLNNGQNCVICARTDFLNLDTKLECVKTSCGDCNKLSEECKHSCLPRLLWLLFDKDERVISALKHENERGH